MESAPTGFLRFKQTAKPQFENQPFDVTWANKKGGISAVGTIWGQKEK
jgi:hypothetical protein